MLGWVNKGMKTFWLYRPVLNADDILLWAGANRVKKIMPLEELHTTIAVVREPVEWPVDLKTNEITITGASMQIFGYTVKALAFECPELVERRAELAERFPQMDHVTNMRPHVSLYRGGRMIQTDYTGDIILGPEQIVEFVEEQGRNIKHVSVATLMNG